MSDVPLREHLEALRADDKEALKLALESASKAVDKAEQAQLRVNQTQNEFRGTLKDQASLLMPRAEYEVNHKSLQKEVDGLKRLVYVGLGGVLMLQFLFSFIVK